MAATYLLRFDDFCPTMNWTVWREVETALIDSGVRPILAVVPDNQDPQLQIEAASEAFWEQVRGWQARGWTIGLHGYQHRYVTKCAGIIGRNRYSEFSGLSYEAQLEKVGSGLAIFAREGVRADVWVAPAHSFDRDTLRALANCGLRTVSDGYFTAPHRDANGMFWIPQQIGRFRQLPAGVWTVCLHHNNWTAADLRRFRADLDTFHGRLTDVNTVTARYSAREERLLDRMSAGLMGMARSGRMAISRGEL
jgi:peptidoglycan/xylan/chitin deacetylase (PgdA/CDA1 family)